MSTIYRQGPQQPWRNHVLRHGTLSRITALAEYVPPVYDGVVKRTHFKARGTPHHGNQRAAAVIIPRPRDTVVTLPARLTASPIPQGSGGSVTQPPEALLPDSYGYETYGYGPYGGEPL